MLKTILLMSLMVFMRTMAAVLIFTVT